MTLLAVPAAVLAVLVVSPAIGQVPREARENPPPEILPVVGKAARYTASPGDSLLSISRRHGYDPETLGRVNGLRPGHRPAPGDALLLPTLYIPPPAARDGVVLNIPERAVYVFRGGRLLDRYPVAVGKPSWPTPTGRFRLLSKLRDPVWITPREMVRREGARERTVAPGAGNPLAGFWMGWHRIPRTGSEIGFHATNVPGSVGGAVSHGCVRLYPEHARRMFSQLSVGTPVTVVYEPVRVGTRDGQIFLSVWPDIYGTGKASPERVERMLRELRLWQRADPAAVRRAVERQDGYPQRISADPEAPPRAAAAR